MAMTRFGSVSTRDDIFVVLGSQISSTKKVQVSVGRGGRLEGADADQIEEETTEGAGNDLDKEVKSTLERAPAMFLKPSEEEMRRRHVLVKAAMMATERGLA